MSLSDVLHMLVTEIEKMTGHDRPDLHDAVDAEGRGPAPEAAPAPAADQPSEADTPNAALGTEDAGFPADPHPESD